MSAPPSKPSLAEHNPLLGLDLERLEGEMTAYHQWLDERADEAYAIAERARSKGLDHKTRVEIPRASDLAGRTEKLLIDHLEGYEVAEEIRQLLAQHDRETTSIMIAQSVARGFREKGFDLEKSIDVGLRVGLAVLTEAVLVAPLEGISEVRLLNNIDGSQFVSVHFAGPIRAAGGTAQALAVLIADMIRREMNVGPYQPTDPEVERVKEEFGLYRGNLQYRPSPEEIDDIVRACPVMINGESTERIECAGYGNVRNIDEARIRGGVLLVIGEGMCLKAPKIQKHTERMKVPGWDFIATFASKGKASEGGGKGGFKSQQIKPITKFMNDIIAGRPVFGGPLQAGGFRLRYGRARPSGLAAASTNTTTMLALDDFITIGTQMKIERPGKACAITPCDEAEGPWVVLDDGSFLRIDEPADFVPFRPQVKQVWDNGELVIGYGEFLENNKHLVPAGYSRDWWASDLLESLTDASQIEAFVKAMNTPRSAWPEGCPGLRPEETEDPNAQFLVRRSWHQQLRSTTVDWEQALAVARRFATSLPPPHNPWFKDLPIEWLPAFLTALETARIEAKGTGLNDASNLPVGARPEASTRQLRFPLAAAHWTAKALDTLEPERLPEVTGEDIPGVGLLPEDPVFALQTPEGWTLHQHGLVKGALMLLGLPHVHDGDDVVVTAGWQAMLEGFGFTLEGDAPLRVKNLNALVEQRLNALRRAKECLDEERTRLRELSKERSTIRIAAETGARQRGLGIAETDRVGREAAASVVDEGPADSNRYLAAQELEDEHAVEGIMVLVRAMSDLRWEHSAPVRVGCRMGRPEKAAPRIMNPMTHSLFPIELNGGNQRLLDNAVQQRTIRVQLGRRTCETCKRESPFLRCHHRTVDAYGEGKAGEACGGVTVADEGSSKARRRGEVQSVRVDDMVEDARIRLGLDRLPAQVKCMKKLNSRDQTPEAIEKGILRAKHNLPVFRDGTVRYDMSDVPVTHFRPREIGVPWKKLHGLGYTHDHLGNPLGDDEQVLEIFPQDFIVAKGAADFLVRTANYVDELLTRFYGMEAFYNVDKPEDLVGHLICALAPHTSGGVLSRIIGWADCSGGYAHPLFHASKRRNCDGDEDAIMMLMDGLLNFSKDILPANRGGQMDAPLVLTTRLNPTEVDKEALNVDSAWFYERDFYEATQSQPHPKDVQSRMDFVERRLGTVAAVRGYGFTHDCKAIDRGPELSAYKTLETMIDKMNGQLAVGHKLRGVSVREVASSVVRSHFLPDLRGNLNAYGRQKVRCLKCAHSYRRMPVAGQCIQPKKETGRGLSRMGVAKSEGELCNGNLALTVSEGAVRKYIEVMRYVMDHYGVDLYTRQNAEWLANSADSLFNNDRAKQLSLADFL